MLGVVVTPRAPNARLQSHHLPGPPSPLRPQALSPRGKLSGQDNLPRFTTVTAPLAVVSQRLPRSVTDLPALKTFEVTTTGLGDKLGH